MANRNRVYNRFDNLVPKLLTSILIIYLGFLPGLSLAATTPEDIWLREAITKNVDSTGRVTSATVRATKRQIVNGTARDIASELLDYKPQRSAVSGVMKNRLAQAVAGGGVAIIGVAAVDALLKGIGWIMKDGVYIKKHLPDDSASQYIYTHSESGSTGTSFADACSKAFSWLKSIRNDAVKGDLVISSSGTSAACLYGMNASENPTRSMPINRKLNPNYNPNNTPVDVPITQQELEDIMFGDYQGDPSANIAPHKNGDWTGVEETMTADSNAGEGTKDKPTNPVSEDIDQKLDANPNKKVTDHKSTDSKGDEETTKEDGTKEQTKTDTKTELPAFCNYAASLCKWIDWTQNDDQTDKEDDFDIDKQELEIPAVVDTSKVQFSSQCPAPLSSSYSLLGRTHSVSYSFDSICTVAVNLKPAVVGCASIAACYIMLGMNRARGED